MSVDNSNLQLGDIPHRNPPFLFADAPNPARRKSVCETIGDFLPAVKPLFSLQARWGRYGKLPFFRRVMRRIMKPPVVPPLPRDLQQLICNLASEPKATLHVSKFWNQATYTSLFNEYKASPHLIRLMAPSDFLPNADRKTAVLNVQQKIKQWFVKDGLKFPTDFNPSASQLEQALKDRSLILLMRSMNLEELESLVLDPAMTASNQAKEIRRWIQENPEKVLSIRRLDMQGLNLFMIPEEIGEFKNLLSLTLGNNCIGQIDPLHSLLELRYLDLNTNQIVQIDALKPLQKINRLYIQLNKIEKIEALQDLKEITTLWADHNRIEKIDPLYSLASLQYCFIQGNAFPLESIDFNKLPAAIRAEIGKELLGSKPRKGHRRSAVRVRSYVS